MAPLQNLAICLALLVIMVAAWRLACAVARLRAEPATALAPLNQMLKKGFFLVQGFFNGVYSLSEGYGHYGKPVVRRA